MLDFGGSNLGGKGWGLRQYTSCSFLATNRQRHCALGEILIGDFFVLDLVAPTLQGLDTPHCVLSVRKRH